MTHHYQDPDGWLAFAQLLGVEEEYWQIVRERETEPVKQEDE